MRKLFTLEHHKIPVGTYRLDYDEDGASEISWSIYPDHRGKTNAKPLIQLTLQNTKCKVIRADIKP